ncbi:MAG: phage integrase family protein [Pseudoduganella sp.]|nr:phage integrase family protein [Pseudoduganella sp.]
MNYAARLKDHEKWRLGTLNILIQKWCALGVQGVDPACKQFLREQRKPGNVKGKAVLTRDPVNGPFSEAEYIALYKAVDAAYGQNEVPLWVAVLTRLLFACGGRISQYASLKLLDLHVENREFVLNLPQVKTGEAHSRTSFKEFDLSPQTGRLTGEYIEGLQNAGSVDTSALFPISTVMTLGLRTGKRSKDDMFFDHCTTHALSTAFSRILNRVAPLTERLNFEPMPICPKRFRYTFGTRLAEEGASKMIIADRLGHSDLQYVDVYVQASPKIVENIDLAIGTQLAPIALAFKVQLIEDEVNSKQKGAPGSRIIDFRVSKKPVGSCSGKGAGCAFHKPIACYTCFKFEPWLDAPHENILKYLQVEREKWKGDPRLATINDDAIDAVQEVMAECVLVMQQRNKGHSV